MDIKKVLVIYKTHLDIGFTDFSKNVIRRYMEEFIPNALSVAKKLREAGSEARLVWTTGSWLIYEYLRTHVGEERERLVQGIKCGDIRWHGLPFTTHTELMSSSLFEYGLSLSKRLDEQFSRKTIAAKMTDVPGHTRAVIPYLREAGIEFLHIGVNPASAVPAVPPLFRWKAESGELLTVMYQKDYGEFTRIGDSDTAVYFAHTGDNIGVQSEEAIRRIYAELREKLPGAEIVAADLNDLAYAVRAIEGTLPVVTDEIGDTWIHGVGTDPKKVSQFRALERLYETMPDGVDKETLARGLIMIPEHTWGLDVKTHLKDHEHYDRESFEKMKTSAPNYLKMEESWQEQRDYLYDAVGALGKEQQEKAVACMAEAVRGEADVTHMRECQTGEILMRGEYQIQFDEAGRIIYLKNGHRLIADRDHALLQIRYEQFSGSDYERFFRQYNRLDEEWAREDFKKLGMEEAAKEHVSIQPKTARVYEGADCIVVKYEFEKQAYEQYGCPERMDAVLYACNEGLLIDIGWFDKPANRIAEAIWVGFEPIGRNKRIRKLSTWIDPKRVVPKGQSRLHATDYGVRYDELEIETLDTALVAPQEPSLLNFCDDRPETGKAFFNLYNNIWGTNFPMWYEEDARFRFVLALKDFMKGKEGE